MFKLRDYQAESLEAIRFGHQEHDSISVELATGLGKTIIFCRYAANWVKYNGSRAMIIAPQITLISQAAKKIFQETGVAPAIEQAENFSPEDEHSRLPYVVASKQTLGSGERYKRFKDVGLVIVDEAHYAATEAYAEILGYFREHGAKILGVSATLKRHDGRALAQIFAECSYQYGMAEAIGDGWLVPIKSKVKQLKSMDLSKVPTVNGFGGKDFATKQLNEVLENIEVIYEIAAAVAEETRGEKTAIFCSSVNEAQAVAERLTDNYGIRCGWICSDEQRCSKQMRLETMQALTHGDLTHVANVGILTQGWDFPGLKNVVMARPTKSRPLYEQILGRVTRPAGKGKGTVVDFAGSTPETRQAAIAASDKPHGQVIDLVDVSLKHKIMTVSDVLGGRYSLKDDAQVVCRFCFAKFPSNMELTLHLDEQHQGDMKRAQLEDEETSADSMRLAEKMLREQRAKVRAEAEFRDREVDVFSGQASNGVGRTQKIMASDKQRKYLWVLGLKDVDQYRHITSGTAKRMIGMFKSGMSASQVKSVNRLR